MSEEFSKQIRSKATSDGNIELSIAKVEKPVPGDDEVLIEVQACLLYTSPSPRDYAASRMPSSA